MLFLHYPIRRWITATDNRGVAVVATTNIDPTITVVAVTTAAVATTRSIARAVTIDVPLLSTTVTPVATRWRYTSNAVDTPPDPSAITVVADELLLRLLLLGLLLGPLLWPWHSAVDQELLLLLLPEPRHISAAPPAEATWITNDVVMGVFVVCQVGLVSDAVVVAVAILTTTIACTFVPLWSCTDLGHMPESSAPFALVHAAHWRIG